MMKVSKVLAMGLISLFATSAFANNKVIVKFEQGYDVSNFSYMGSNKVEALIPELGIYAVELPTKNTRAAALNIRSLPGVVYAQQDHKVTQRATPNDKNFSQQWDMLLDNSNFGIDAVNAWTAFGTGGVDYAGNDIVVAVVDGGVDLKHQDLVANIWVNKGEIPGNGKDDDGTGFVDDINGWNAYNNTGAVTSNGHGTHVAGTVGAAGNNSMHGAGVNWNVKIMAINGSSGNTSTVLKAYGYVLKQKQLWLSSGGTQGANVVATNSSFGVDYGDCSSGEYATWNDIYNEMGSYGILHAIATANLNSDVDVKGDVPTGCTAESIIAVTNTQQNGKRHGSAAYGKTMIDIGAPGTNIYSTLPGNSWGANTGTSMATPHVAGAVAYLHSVASAKFNGMYLNSPEQGALALKEIMLKNVTPNAELNGKVVSNGNLNINKAGSAISTY